MRKVYIITIENPISEEVKVRAVYARKAEAMKAFKNLQKIFTDKKDPLGLNLQMAHCEPNADGEFMPIKNLVSVGI